MCRVFFVHVYHRHDAILCCPMFGLVLLHTLVARVRMPWLSGPFVLCPLLK